MDNSSSEKLSVECQTLSVLGLNEVASLFRAALEENFQEVSVTVTECPDLTLSPYRMAATGICGSTKICDVGGIPYLAPVPQLSHKYDFQDIRTMTDSGESCFFLGAGAGPFPEMGCNCELIANLVIGSDEQTKNASQVAKMNKDGSCGVSGLTTTKFAILGNFFVSKGESGKVIEVRAKKRTGADNFVTILRKSLLNNPIHGNPIGVGGVFIVKSGKVKMHVMPDFSQSPLKSVDDITNWLRFFEFPAPMIFQSVFVSDDPGLDLRLEHTHGHSLTDDTGSCQESHGGHYHYDTTPDEVEYVGYFNLAEAVYRIDRPIR